MSRSLSKAVLSANPWCVFCGGRQPAETVDHIPPISVFTGRDRPKGLEFSACHSCNQGTRRYDQVFALLSRFHGDEEGSEQYQNDIQQLIIAISNNYPEIITELTGAAHPSYNQGALLEVGPNIFNTISHIGAKIGLALHFELKKRIVPLHGGVLVSPIFNFEAMQEGLPSEILAFFPHEKTLMQGKKSVPNQFTYSSLHEGNISAHWVTFRQAFGLQIFVVEDLESLGGKFDRELFVQPGWIQKL